MPTGRRPVASYMQLCASVSPQALRDAVLCAYTRFGCGAQDCPRQVRADSALPLDPSLARSNLMLVSSVSNEHVYQGQNQTPAEAYRLAV